MNYDLEAARLKKDWAENPRWKGITRGYSAEDVVRRSGHPAWIVRTSLLYGENRWEPGAPASFPLQVVRAAQTAGRLVA